MTDDQIVEDTVVEETTATSAEDHALEGGWKPEGEWEGEEGKWVDAKTFNMRGELMDRIKSQSSQLRGQDRKMVKMEASLKQLADHNTKIEEASYKKALTDLKALKVEALEMDDHSQVVEIDDKISDLKEAQKDVPQEVQGQEPGTDPQIEAWVNENSWYKTDPALQGAADALADSLYATRIDLQGDTEALLSEVKVQMQQRFPEQMGVRKTKRQSVSEPSNVNNAQRSGAKKYTAKHLNAEQLSFGRTFVDAGAMKDLAEYATQLADIGELDIQKGS